MTQETKKTSFSPSSGPERPKPVPVMVTLFDRTATIARKQKSFVTQVEQRLTYYREFLAREKEAAPGNLLGSPVTAQDYLDRAVRMARYEAQVEVLEDVWNLTQFFWSFPDPEPTPAPFPAAAGSCGHASHTYSSCKPAKTLVVSEP